MTDAEHRSGKKTSWQPFLDILHLAVNKILHKEDESSTKDSVKKAFLRIREFSPDLLRNQKAMYDKLVVKGIDKEFADEAMLYMYEAGVIAGML